jgi:hypothetical protein
MSLATTTISMTGWLRVGQAAVKFPVVQNFTHSPISSIQALETTCLVSSKYQELFHLD